jgi:hypothetical protein
MWRTLFCDAPLILIKKQFQKEKYDVRPPSYNSTPSLAKRTWLLGPIRSRTRVSDGGGIGLEVAGVDKRTSNMTTASQKYARGH